MNKYRGTTQDFYNSSSMEGGFFDQKYQLLSRLIKKNSSVIDLGCYDGRVGEYLHKNLSCSVDGTDISDKNIAKSKTLNKKYVFDLNDSKWPIRKQYDYVLFTDVIEHIFATDQFMQNVHKLVKPRGYIIFATPNIASLGRRILLLLGKNPFIEVSNHKEVNLFNAPVVGHIRYFTVPTMKRLAEYHGFKVTDVIPTPSQSIMYRVVEKINPNLCWHIFVKAQKK